MKDVAELAGVSWTTVSNVIHDHPNVRPETRARVEEAIRTLGYRANPAGRHLRQGRTGTVGIAVPSLSLPQHASLTDALIKELAAKGLVALIEQTGGDPARERRAVEGRLARNVDGVIFYPAAMSGLEIARHRAEMPLVVLGEHTEGAGVDQVGIDAAGAAREITRHLLATGRDKIAFLGHRPRRARGTTERRLLAMLGALRQEGLDIGSRHIIAVEEWSYEAGAGAAEHLLTQLDHVNGLLCANDLLALGAMHALLRRGVRVPDDIAVVGWDDLPESSFSNPTLTSISPDRAETARRAVGAIHARLEKEAASPAVSTVPFTLEVRESTVGRAASQPPEQA